MVHARSLTGSPILRLRFTTRFDCGAVPMKECPELFQPKMPLANDNPLQALEVCSNSVHALATDSKVVFLGRRLPVTGKGMSKGLLTPSLWLPYAWMGSYCRESK